MTTQAAAVLTFAQQSGGGPGILFWIIYLGLIALVIAGFWKVFEKAGHPGWAAIVPIYNVYILTKIAGRPWWWLLLLLIPFVNIIVIAVLSIDVAKSFGQSILFGVGLWLLGFIFYPLLGFGKYQYQGPAAAV